MKTDAAAKAIVSVGLVDFSPQSAVRTSDSMDVQECVDFVFIGADMIVPGKKADSSSVAELQGAEREDDPAESHRPAYLDRTRGAPDKEQTCPAHCAASGRVIGGHVGLSGRVPALPGKPRQPLGHDQQVPARERSDGER